MGLTSDQPSIEAGCHTGRHGYPGRNISNLVPDGVQTFAVGAARSVVKDHVMGTFAWINVFLLIIRVDIFTAWPDLMFDPPVGFDFRIQEGFQSWGKREEGCCLKKIP